MRIHKHSVPLKQSLMNASGAFALVPVLTEIILSIQHYLKKILE